MENTTEKPKCIKEVVVVLELTEQPTSPVFPVPGADGSEIGLMTFCPIRNRHCLRMPVDVFRRHKENLFTARRRFFHLIPDLEFIYEEGEEREEQSLVPALEARVAELEAALAKAKSSKKTARPRRRKPAHKEPIDQ
jgi:hypothetical protein